MRVGARGALTRAALLLVVLSLVAACGGGSDTRGSGEPTSATPKTSAAPAPPTASTLADLAAALPTASHLPTGITLARTCPADGEGCDQYPDNVVVVEGNAEPASPEGAENVKDQATPKDFLAVQGVFYADAAAAQESIGEAREGVEQYVGTYDVTRDDGRKSRGTGAIDELEIDGWTGIASERTEVSSDSEKDQGLLVSTIKLVNGQASVVAFVSLSAAGRAPTAAKDLADVLVHDYLVRLR